MCGRYAVHSSPSGLAKHFSATLQYHFSKSYNIAPTAIIPVLISLDSHRTIVPMRWGLIPSWHKEDQKMPVLNNAKVETVDTKPSFRASFKRHRCLIIANGFYEWDSTTKPKQPHYFHHNADEPIALAGIWDRWTLNDHTIDSCCIITEPANKMVSKVHDRMPAIIDPDNFDDWLDINMQDTKVAKKLALKTEVYKSIVSFPVTTKMNRSSYNNVHCIEKI